jgi:hypothetical protein
MNNKYRFGIELEGVIQRSHLDDFKRGVEELGFKITDDGSIQVSEYGDRGIEIKSARPMTLTELDEKVKKLDRLCDVHNVQVNRSCGYHVHISHPQFFNRTFIQRLTLVWIAIEDVLLATQPQSRLNNHYCQRKLLEYVQSGKRPLPQSKDRLVSELSQLNRYHTINYSSLAEHGTIEIRMHAGTFNATKILNWVRLMVSVFEYVRRKYDSKQITQLFESDINDHKIGTVLDMLSVSDDIKKFYLDRVQNFLYGQLGREQKAARSALKLVPERIKIQKKVDLANEEYRRMQRRMQNYLGVFEGREQREETTEGININGTISLRSS